MNNGNHRFKLANTIRGRGPTVILVHGLGSSRQDWNLLTTRLVSAGYKTCSVDLLGHGDSPKPNTSDYYTIQSIYKAFETWIDDLEESGPYHMVGHSLGGYLSLNLALRRPDKVRAMTVIDPMYSLRQIHPILRFLSTSINLGTKLLPKIPEGWIDAAMSLDPVTSSQFSKQARRRIAIDIKRASPQVLHITRNVPDLTPELAAISQPCQVIWGDLDITLMADSFPRLVDSLPQASAEVIRGTRHQPHIGLPEILNPLVLEFVNQQSRII